MSMKPILFKTEMVRAILDGRKSCTRRICKDANECTVPDMDFYNADKRTYAVHNFSDKKHTEQLSIAERTCPICQGDILYVRETWFKGLKRYMYRADYTDAEKYYKNGKEVAIRWHPSIHMPKEAARIFLRVTNVRVERLQDMTDDDAEAEGCFDYTSTALGFPDVWDSTIKKSGLDCYGWNANPWVWVIEFERCDKPESEEN